MAQNLIEEALSAVALAVRLCSAMLCGRHNPLKPPGSLALILANRFLIMSNDNWQAVFDSEYVPLDTLIDGVKEAIGFLSGKVQQIIFLTSRPESMREATEAWLEQYDLLLIRPNSPRLRELIMKAPAFQYVKTVVWKAGIVQTLEALYSATDLLIVDDEQANIDEHLKYFSNIQTRELCKSLAEAVAKLNGTWVEPDPFLPPED